MDPRKDPNLCKNLQICTKIWEENFSWSIKIMKISFLYPFQNKILQIFGNLILFSCLLLLLASTILKLFNEIAIGIKKSTLVEIIFQIIAMIMMVVLYISLIGSKKKIHLSLIMMAKIWLRNEDFQKKRMEYCKRGYFLSNFTAGSILLSLISFGTAPVAIPSFLTWALQGNRTYEKTLALHTEFFVVEDEYFYHIFAAQLVFLFVYGLLMISMNCMLCWIIIILFGEIRCLQYKYERINEAYHDKMGINEESANTWICEQLKDLIRTHQILINLYGIIQKMSDPLMFVLLTGCCCLVVLTGTSMVVLMETDLTGAAKMLFAFCISLWAIIFASIPSQFIKTVSEDFYITSCEMNGDIYSPKVQKMLLFIIMRSIKPFVLTAGRIIELNFETCSRIIKTSMSYVAAFRSVYTS